ncbi:cobalamin synthase [Phycicoccus badiiscoriae]|uniref:Cobalamin synthase n=1 Tax=Pedococcus badiiscoriae TaxID=642776 RepID=A0A852WNZ4_9MICO|nr:hypothetical protein [Pedococcus badiiscoriae]NYG07096.1 cobalamin synthase [Pedococcus badiiscoriae]
MSPPAGRRPGRRPGGVAAFAPIVVAICAIVLVRDGVGAVFPRLNPWALFVIALVVGWLAYAGVERWFARRNGGRPDDPAGPTTPADRSDDT